MPEDTIFRIIISLHLAAAAQNSIHALETGAARRWNKFLICGHAGVDTVFSRQQLNTFRLKTALSSKSCVALKNNTKEFPRPVENLCHSFARRKNEFLFLPPPSFSSPTFLFLAEINFHSINLAARSRVFQPRQITKIRKMCVIIRISCVKMQKNVLLRRNIRRKGNEMYFANDLISQLHFFFQNLVSIFTFLRRLDEFILYLKRDCNNRRNNLQHFFIC